MKIDPYHEGAAQHVQEIILKKLAEINALSGKIENNWSTDKEVSDKDAKAIKEASKRK